MGTSPKIVSIDDSGIKPCNAHANRNSCRASDKIPVMLKGSKFWAENGSPDGSSRLSASVMQDSMVKGGNIRLESDPKNTGSLLLMNERYMFMEPCGSVLLTAFARTSNEAAIKSEISDGTLS